MKILFQLYNILYNLFLGDMPKQVAKFLNLPDIDKYTGHSFRVTSATMLANAGGTSIMLH